LNGILEAVMAFFAAAGLLWLCRVLFGRMYTPTWRTSSGVYAVVPATGDGEHLEYDVKSLLWLRGRQPAGFTIVIADQGLNATGRATAGALIVQGQGVVMCPMERLTQYLST
jgi:hypothetical protein